MKVNLNIPFLDYSGHPYLEKDNEGNEHEIIMADFVAKNLFTIAQLDGKRMEADKMLLAYKLSRRIIDKPGEVKLTSEETSFIKEIMSKFLVVGCYGQLVDVLENNK